MSQLNQGQNEALPENVYFDILQTNFKSTTTKPPIFTINETRASPFVKLPEKYDLSILRFQIDTGTLPLFIPAIAPDQSDVNRTIYSVTMVDTDYPDNPQQVYLSWIPQDQSASTPPTPANTVSKTQDNTTGYYNCYSYNWLCDMVYNGLSDALVNLTADIGAANMIDPTPDSDIYPPLIYWDPSTSSAIMQAQLNVYEERLSRKIQIYFNAPLFNLFNSFQSAYLGYDGVTFGKNNRLIFVDIGGINKSSVIPQTGNTYDVINLTQEYSTSEQICPISSLVFTSNTLPVVATQTSNAVKFVNGIPIISGTNASMSNIISDMVSSSGLYRSGITYSPTAEYRRISLMGNRPISNLDIEIYYRLKDGSLVPFRLASGGSVSIKLAFLSRK
tara:strand:+ start:1836 stop:3002 length:1167 start_codon:yes stop_codon:yes gene_type:complete